MNNERYEYCRLDNPKARVTFLSVLEDFGWTTYGTFSGETAWFHAYVSLTNPSAGFAADNSHVTLNGTRVSYADLIRRVVAGPIKQLHFPRLGISIRIPPDAQNDLEILLAELTGGQLRLDYSQRADLLAFLQRNSPPQV